MSNTATVQELYAAFGRGDVPAILAKLADDVVWESEGPAIISFSGIRHGKAEAKGFFDALARTISIRNSPSRNMSLLAIRS